MISTYENYLPMEKSLPIEDMVKLHNEMALINKEEKMDTDPSRSACHNSLIVKFNQLARYLKMQGKSASWRDTLGYEENDKYNRKRIGDFSCYIVFINSISSR